MRVTNLGSTYSQLKLISDSQSKINDLNRDLTSTKKLHNPSDDPAATGRVINYTRQLSNNETYLKNIGNATSFMEESELIMEQIHDSVTDALTELASVNSATEGGTFSISAEKIDALFDNILQLANTKHDEKYLFSGTDFSTPPFSFDSATNSVVMNSSDISGEVRVKISSNTNQKINIPGSEIFGDIDGSDIFNTLITIKDNLNNGIKPTDAQIKSLEDFNENLRLKTSESGGLLNQLSSTEEMLNNQKTKLQEMMSADTDTDTAKTLIDLQSYDYTLQLAYKVTSMTLSKSLMDYL